MKLKDDRIKTWRDEPIKVIENPDGSYVLDVDYIREKLREEGIFNSSTGQTVRVKNIMRDPVSLHTNVEYTDGIVEAYNELNFPEAKDIQVGMTRTQVAMKLNTKANSSHITNGSFIDTGVPVRSGVSSQAAGAGFPYARAGKASETIVVGNSWSNDSALRRQMEAAGACVHKGWETISVPWGDPLAAEKSKADNRYADVYEGEIFYHTVFPDMPARKIIEEAKKILETKKNIRFGKFSIQAEGSGDSKVYRVIYSVLNCVGQDLDQGKLIEVLIPMKTFKRHKNKIDEYAKLRGNLDTNTYIILRIAYLLLKLTQMNSRDVDQIQTDLITVIGHTTKPIFHF